MRNNIAKVIKAFKEGKAIKGDSRGTCQTDGRNIWSWNMLLAKRFTDNSGKERIVVIGEEYAPSITTKKQIMSIMEACPEAVIVREGSVLTWDFKFDCGF